MTLSNGPVSRTVRTPNLIELKMYFISTYLLSRLQFKDILGVRRILLNEAWWEETLRNMTTLQIFCPIFPLRVGTFFAAPVTLGSEWQQHQLQREQKDKASGGEREEDVEEILISGSFPRSHAHCDISQLNIMYEFYWEILPASNTW